MENNEQVQMLTNRFEALEKKIDAVYISVEKTRKYFMVIMWVTVAMVVLPAIGLAVVIPTFINTYMGSFDVLL